MNRIELNWIIFINKLIYYYMMLYIQISKLRVFFNPVTILYVWLNMYVTIHKQSLWINRKIGELIFSLKYNYITCWIKLQLIYLYHIITKSAHMNGHLEGLRSVRKWMSLVFCPPVISTTMCLTVFPRLTLPTSRQSLHFTCTAVWLRCPTHKKKKSRCVSWHCY